MSDSAYSPLLDAPTDAPVSVPTGAPALAPVDAPVLDAAGAPASIAPSVSVGVPANATASTPASVTLSAAPAGADALAGQIPVGYSPDALNFMFQANQSGAGIPSLGPTPAFGLATPSLNSPIQPRVLFTASGVPVSFASPVGALSGQGIYPGMFLSPAVPAAHDSAPSTVLGNAASNPMFSPAVSGAMPMPLMQQPSGLPPGPPYFMVPPGAPTPGLPIYQQFAGPSPVPAPDVLSHPAFHSPWTRPRAAVPAFGSHGIAQAASYPQGLSPAVPLLPQGLPPTAPLLPSPSFAASSFPSAARHASAFPTVDSIKKAAKDAKSSTKYFDGEGTAAESAAKFADWIAFWRRVCAGQDQRLLPYFTLSALSHDSERALTQGPDCILDGVLFTLLSTFLHGTAEQFTLSASVTSARSARLLLLEMLAVYSQNFSGDAHAVTTAIASVVFPEADSPLNSILRIEALFARLSEIQVARGEHPPSERQQCFDVVRRLPSNGVFSELKRLEATSPTAPEVLSLSALRVSSHKMFQLYAANNPMQALGKRSLAALQVDDCAEDADGDTDRLCASLSSGGPVKKKYSTTSGVHKESHKDRRQRQQQDRPVILRPCLFCRANARFRKTTVPDVDAIRHRFSDCPLLPSDLRKALSEPMTEDKLLASLDLADGFCSEVGFAKDFVEQLDGWGQALNGLDFLADPPSTHPLAEAQRRVVD